MATPLEVPLNAATTLQLSGNTYLHGWMRQRSESVGTRKPFQLSARARQFSSFMLVIGTMEGPNRLIHGATPLELIAEGADRARFKSSFPLMLEGEESVDC